MGVIITKFWANRHQITITTQVNNPKFNSNTNFVQQICNSIKQKCAIIFFNLYNQNIL